MSPCRPPNCADEKSADLNSNGSHTNPVITPERVNYLAFPVLRQDNWRDNRNVRSYRRRLNLAAESVLSGIGVVSSGMSGA